MRHFASTIIIFSILAIGLFSCTGTKDRTQLQRIEKMMDGNPDADSAMMLLQGINPNCLSSEADRAYYALLLSQAKEKQYETVTDDSLISIAVKYYSRGNYTYYNMLSQYYLGRIKFNAGDYPQSIVAMFKALECATELDNKFWMGMTCQSLSDIYNETYNAAEELVYAEKEYQYFKANGRQPYVNYALLDMARAKHNFGIYESSISYSKQCLDSAKKYKDNYLFVSAQRIIGKSNIGKDNYGKTLSSYLTVCSSDYANTSDSAYLGLSYIGCGNISKALDILKNMPDDEPLLKNMLKYKIYSKTDSIKQSFAALESVDSLTNADFKKRIGTNITSSAIDFYKLSKKVAEAQNETSRIWLQFMIVVVVLVSLLLAIVVFWAYTYRKKQQEAIEQKIEIAHQLKEALTTKEAEYNRARDSMKMMMSTNCKKLDEMCQRVFENGDSDVARKHISDSVTSIIKQVKSDPNVIKMFEEFVDLNRSGLISDFKTDLPGLPDTYNKLFLFSVLGFSDNTIVLFMGKNTVTQIYNYRRHLKDKIKQLDESRHSKYLVFL